MRLTMNLYVWIITTKIQNVYSVCGNKSSFWTIVLVSFEYKRSHLQCAWYEEEHMKPKKEHAWVFGN
jgi:hypothetical protein